MQLRQGEISFAEFMQQALYSAEFGYYSKGLSKFGSTGDFVTAPELSPLFAQTLALQCEEILKELADAHLFEFGAGSGRLCVDLLRQLEKVQCLPASYLIMEISDNLRQRQQALVQQEIPHLAPIVHWLDSWPTTPFNGIVIANEVLDAMPVHRFLFQNGHFYESMLSLNQNGDLIEQFKPCADPRLQTYLEETLLALDSPYLSEVNLFINGWIEQCAQMLSSGVIFLIDYGFPRHEYYHPDRKQGTVMCHYQHKAHTNPLIHIGQQDITAHVDFTHVAEAAEAAGLMISGYTNQAAFLLSAGLLSLLENLSDERELFKAKQAIKQLTHPSEMGELFKVMALSKNLDRDFRGFQLHDKRATL